NFQTGNLSVFGQKRLGSAVVQEFYSCFLRGMRQLSDQSWSAALWLDARRPLREIIGWLRKFDVVRADPFDRRRRFLRETGEITPITLELRGGEHVLNEICFDAVGCRHSGVGRRPARIAAGRGFRGFVDERDVDGLPR